MHISRRALVYLYWKYVLLIVNIEINKKYTHMTSGTRAITFYHLNLIMYKKYILFCECHHQYVCFGALCNGIGQFTHVLYTLHEGIDSLTA